MISGGAPDASSRMIVPGGVRLTPSDVNGIQVPDAAKTLGFTVPIKDLPLNLQIQSVRTTSEGLLVQGLGRDVPLRA